ncbi:hypothetical protein NPIL_248031 [Nephila pilipes]|uniref:Uncharacterized protein n=1 Tax=Nephila pilipes TaxID=299642 RepID=A0A8X6N686_NEPPI|nr:hypothetical protein NPIL_248031 [Nephila pilipes]
MKSILEDSTTVITWIKREDAWSTFCQNRVSKIKETLARKKTGDMYLAAAIKHQLAFGSSSQSIPGKRIIRFRRDFKTADGEKPLRPDQQLFLLEILVKWLKMRS